MKYEKIEKWMLGKKVTHVVTLSSGVIVDISYEGEPDFPVKVKYDGGILAGETSWAFLRNLEFLEGKPSEEVGAQENSQISWEVGQEVFCLLRGKGFVVRVGDDEETPYTVEVDFGYTFDHYTIDGKIFDDHKGRVLFFSEPVITAELFPPKKPFKSLLKVGDLITIKDKHCSDVVIVSFLKEEEERIYYTYIDGQRDYSHKDNVSVYPLGAEIKFN